MFFDLRKEIFLYLQIHLQYFACTFLRYFSYLCYRYFIRICCRKIMKQKLLLFFGICFCNLGLAFGQFEGRSFSARSFALSSILSPLDDFASAVSNQGALGEIQQVTVGIGIANRYLTAELSDKALAVAVPVKDIGVFSAVYNHFGNELYSEQFAGLAYGRKFGKNFSVGLQFDYLFTYFQPEDLRNQNLFTFELGMQYHFTKEFWLGFHLFNPISIQRDSYEDERIPAVFQLGAGYNILQDLTAFAEVEKNIVENLSLKFGLEYRFLSILSARLAYASQPSVYSFGIGIAQEQWTIDAGFQIHSYLGFCPAISGCYKF